VLIDAEQRLKQLAAEKRMLSQPRADFRKQGWSAEKRLSKPAD
jgi:hypothetical protein